MENESYEVFLMPLTVPQLPTLGSNEVNLIRAKTTALLKSQKRDYRFRQASNVSKSSFEVLQDNPKYCTFFSLQMASAWRRGAQALRHVITESHVIEDVEALVDFASLLSFGILSGGQSPVGIDVSTVSTKMPRNATAEKYFLQLKSLAHDTLWPPPKNPVLVPSHLASRLLYTNPVCFLAVPLPETQVNHGMDDGTLPHCPCNMMTISWLTATDNKGNFFMSMNKSRASSDFVQRSTHQVFSLSVACEGCEDMLISLGTTSARIRNRGSNLKVEERPGSSSGSAGGHEMNDSVLYQGNKVRHCCVEFCKPGWKTYEANTSRLIEPVLQTSMHTLPSSRLQDAHIKKRNGNISKKAQKRAKIDKACESGVVCASRAVAHIVARTTSLQTSLDESHIYVHAQIICAFSRPEYWRSEGASGSIQKEPAIFAPRGACPGLLTFYGSKTFGVVR